MRRSKAPSMANKGKRFCREADNKQEFIEESYVSEPAEESYNWGSKDGPKAAERDFISKNKRYFNIVWRDVTTKKHKTWKGDGTLEVNLLSMKAVAKDEAGKYLGCCTKLKVEDLQEDYQIVIGGKEIEIQNEIKDEDEIYEMRKMQVRNRNWGEEEYITPEMKAAEEKKPKGVYRYKPILVLKPLQNAKTREQKTDYENKLDDRATTSESTKKCQLASHNLKTNTNIGNTGDKTNSPATSTPYLGIKNKSSATSRCILKSLFCFVKPSELQHFLFQKIREYYNDNKNTDLSSLDIPCILRQICNHPSFIKHSPSDNMLAQYLTSSLPDWAEMGPFDSGKLEFVQYFLQSSMEKTRQIITILAKNANVLNMMQGLCDYMHINCLRFNSSHIEDTAIKTTRVLLTDSIKLLNFSGENIEKLHIIVFEDIFNYIIEIQDFKQFVGTFTVYYLVTSFSIEELLILPSQQKNINHFNYEELLNLVDMEDSFCYVHRKINCNCCGSCGSTQRRCDDLDFFKSWSHWANPFDDKFLQESDLDNSSGNLLSVFYKMDL